jgi:hypothetical protein
MCLFSSLQQCPFLGQMVVRWGHPPSLVGWSSDADHIVMGLESSPVITSELIQQINIFALLTVYSRNF